MAPFFALGLKCKEWSHMSISDGEHKDQEKGTVQELAADVVILVQMMCVYRKVI